MRMFVITALYLFFPALLQAQQDDYQLRFTFHEQILLGKENGLAFWTNMPDLTQTQPHRSVLLGGWLHKDSNGWREVMGGAFVRYDGVIKPLFDIRLYSGGKKADVYSEIMLRPDMAIIQAFVTTSVSKRIRVGLEWDMTTPIDQKVKAQVLAGPRISFPVPKVPWLQTATTCFFDFRGGTVVRTYISVNR